jgi:hypothetical protein
MRGSPLRSDKHFAPQGKASGTEVPFRISDYYILVGLIMKAEGKAVGFIKGQYALVDEGGWQAHKQRLEHCLRQEHKADCSL